VVTKVTAADRGSEPCAPASPLALLPVVPPASALWSRCDYRSRSSHTTATARARLMTAAISAACSFARGTRPCARTRRRTSSPGRGRWAPARCATWTAPATSACQGDAASGQPVPDGR